MNRPSNHPVSRLVTVSPRYGSKLVISLFIRRVIVPPYCGVPRLSHQLPVVEVVVGFIEVCAILVVVSGGAVVLVEAVLTGVVDVDVVDDLQDDKISDITMRQVSIIQIIPLFISSSYYLTKISRNLTTISF
jgi:hypothetical protein